MVSQHITWHTARFPPVVGAGVLDDPFLRPPPDTRCRAGCGRQGPPAKGGTPGEGPPFDPLLRFVSTREFRALRRAARAPPLDPARFFVKKRGKKLLLGETSASPSPSPLGRVIQSVREADTLAAEWQLPREWERRAGPETSRGRHHPSAFLWGSTPFLWARPKKWGGIAAQRKDNRQQNGEFLQPTPPGRAATSARVMPQHSREQAAGGNFFCLQYLTRAQRTQGSTGNRPYRDAYGAADVASCGKVIPHALRA